jgi:hypothetical protein
MMANVSAIIKQFEKETRTPQQIACLRIRYLQDEEGEGLSSIVVPLLTDAVDVFLKILLKEELSSRSNSDNTLPDDDLSSHSSTVLLQRLLDLHLQLSRQDPTLGEELGRAGSHVQLMRLMRYDSSRHSPEQQDTIMELQDVACQITTHVSSFPLKFLPFGVDELRRRLPLIFDMAPATDKKSGPLHFGNRTAERILINQVTTRQSAQKDVGFGRFRSVEFTPSEATTEC